MRQFSADTAYSGCANAGALVVAADERDKSFMKNVLGALGLTPHFAEDAGEAHAAMARGHMPIVVVDGDAQAVCWRELLRRPETGARRAPRFIVLSGLADARLWAEALNLGVYDLLLKPLDALETSCVVRSALSDGNGTGNGGEPAGVRGPVAWKRS